MRLPVVLGRWYEGEMHVRLRRRTILRSRWVVLAVAAVLSLSACGGGGASETTSGSTEGESGELLGEALFNESVVGGLAGCVTCHSLTPATDLTGPSLASMGVVAASRVPGKTAEDYLREAILDPDVFLVEDYDAGTMDGWDEVLSDTQVDSLVEFMMEQ
jgi:mono/diheme cytochrome c family protein